MPLSQAISRPRLTAASSAKLFVASPTWREKPEIHLPQWSRNMPPTPARPGFPKALPSVLSLRNLMIWGIRLGGWWSMPARKWNSVAACTEEYRRACWMMDLWLNILSFRASQSFQQVNGNKTFQGMRWGWVVLSELAFAWSQSCSGRAKKDMGVLFVYAFH